MNSFNILKNIQTERLKEKRQMPLIYWMVRFLLVLQVTKTIGKIINISQQHSIINKSCVNKPNKQSVFALIKILLRLNVLGDIFQKNPSLWILLCNVPPLIILLIALCIAWCFFGCTEFLEDKWIASSLNERITHVCSLKNGTVPKKMRRHIHTLLWVRAVYVLAAACTKSDQWHQFYNNALMDHIETRRSDGLKISPPASCS